jgi:hypothetical protein
MRACRERCVRQRRETRAVCAPHATAKAACGVRLASPRAALHSATRGRTQCLCHAGFGRLNDVKRDVNAFKVHNKAH